jgi:hypothetical protein
MSRIPKSRTAARTTSLRSVYAGQMAIFLMTGLLIALAS